VCNITLIDDDEDDDRTYYWGYIVNGVWKVSRLTGGVGNLLIDDYDPNGTKEKAYSAYYINNLIQDNWDASKDDEQKQRYVYSVKHIDNLIKTNKSEANNSDEVTYSSKYIDNLISDSEINNDDKVYNATYVNNTVTNLKQDISDV
jgi:hypothetical protein